jgi:signal peptidase I
VPELVLDKRRRRRPRPWRVLVAVLAVLAALGVLALVLPEPFGGRLSVATVAGSSMAPTYEDGDVVVVWRADDYRPGAVVAYAVPAGQVGAGGTVVHRVIDETAAGYRTQGDHNLRPDPWVAPDGEIRGRVVWSVPNGRVVLPRVAGASALVAVAALVVLGVRRVRRRHRAAPSLPTRPD